MIAFLALFSCVTSEAVDVPVDGPEALTSDAYAAPTADGPRAAMKLNMQCFGGGEDENYSSNSNYRSGVGARPVPPPPVTPAPQPPRTAEVDDRSTRDAGVSLSDKGKADKPSKAAAAPKEPAPKPKPSPKPEPAKPASKGESKPADAKAPMAPAATEAAKAGSAMDALGGMLPMAVPIGINNRVPDIGTPIQPDQALKPSLDWGATVYLSNDDSMSLASAQRVIYSVENGMTPNPREVRPHELLNFFSFDTAETRSGDLFSVQPSAERTGPTQLTAAFAVHGGIPPRKPLDLTMVIDRSGSMAGEGRMDYIRGGLHKMEEQLRPGDRVDVVLFDDQVCTPLQDYVVGRDAPSSLGRVIDALQPRGSTDIGIGMREGYRIATAADRMAGGKRNQRVMLITDAVVNSGDVDPSTLADIAKAYEDHDIRLTGIGVGRDFRDDVLDRMTEKGKGAYVYVGSGAVADRVFGSQFASLTQTIAHDVQFALKLPKSLAMKRFYGEEASTDASDVQPIHYYAGTTQLFLQDLEVDPKLLQPSDAVTFQIKYEDPSTHAAREQTYTTTVGEMLGASRHNLDKGRALMAWTDVVQGKAMGSNPCGPTYDLYATRAKAVTGDAEMAYVDRLSQKICPGYRPNLIPEKPASAGLKVKVDSDVPIGAVALTCGGSELRSTLSGSDTVARFPGAPAGACDLVLEGVVPMATKVTVPASGGDVRCMVRGGNLSCG